MPSIGEGRTSPWLEAIAGIRQRPCPRLGSKPVPAPRTRPEVRASLRRVFTAATAIKTATSGTPGEEGRHARRHLWGIVRVGWPSLAAQSIGHVVRRPSTINPTRRALRWRLFSIWQAVAGFLGRLLGGHETNWCIANNTPPASSEAACDAFFLDTPPTGPTPLRTGHSRRFSRQGDRVLARL